MRTVVGGINWIWYYGDTEEEAIAYFKELTGTEPGYNMIVAPVERTPAAEHDEKMGL